MGWYYLKVLFVNYVDKIAGGERYIANIINNLPSQIDVFLLTPNQNSQIEELLHRKIIKYSKKFIRTFGPFPRFSFSLFFEVIRIIKKEKIDAIHLNDHYLFPTFLLIKKILSVKIIFTSHGLWDTYFYINKLLLKLLDPITIAATPTQFKRIEDYVSYKYLLPFFIEERKYFKDGLKDKIRLGIVGRFSPVKNFEMAFDILELLDNKKYELQIFGDRSVHLNEESNEYLKKLEERIKSNSNLIHNRVVHDLHGIYSNIDILLVPSLSESFSLVSIEALSFGIPIVSSLTEGTPVIIEVGVNGFICETKEDFCSKIEYIVEHYNKFSIEAFSSSKKFSKNNYIKELVDIYEK